MFPFHQTNAASQKLTQIKLFSSLNICLTLKKKNNAIVSRIADLKVFSKYFSKVSRQNFSVISLLLETNQFDRSVIVGERSCKNFY